MHGKQGLCIAAAVLFFALSACGQDGTAGQPQTTQTAPAQTTAQRQAQADMASPDVKQTDAALPDETQTTAPQTTAVLTQADIGPLFGQYVRDRVADGVYTMRSKQSGLTLITTFSGEDSVLESDAAGLLRLTLIHKDGHYFMVCGSTQKYVELSAEEYEKQAGETLKKSSLHLENMHLKQTGEQTVGGKKYSTEIYDEGDLGTVTYYFDDSGLRRSSVDRNGTVTEIDTMEVLDEADPAAFEIPQGYTRITDPSQLFTP